MSNRRPTRRPQEQRPPTWRGGMFRRADHRVQPDAREIAAMRDRLRQRAIDGWKTRRRAEPPEVES